jgi:hypothetical protein
MGISELILLLQIKFTYPIPGLFQIIPFNQIGLDLGKFGDFQEIKIFAAMETHTAAILLAAIVLVVVAVELIVLRQQLSVNKKKLL